MNPQEDKLSRFVYDKADWDEFSRLCENLVVDNYANLADPISKFTKDVVDIMEKTIPKTSVGSTSKPRKPWFNAACKQAINERRKALDQLKRHPDLQHVIQYKRKYAIARKIIKASKTASWRKFVSTVNNRTSLKTMWNVVRKIEGKHSQAPIHHLKQNGHLFTSKEEIANVLGQTIQLNSSSDNYSPEFQRVKTEAERTKMDFRSDNSETYNDPITMRELKDAINSGKNSSPGPDNIHYTVIKHFPTATLVLLLGLFNAMFSSGTFPKRWREAYIVPIPKPNKDLSDPQSYRPISLTNCLCKTFERIITARLMWYLEKNKLLDDVQSGFRRQRSTIDHLVGLETYVREAFVRKLHAVTVFFDLEKAYDMSWKYGVLRDLHQLGLRGRLPIFIQNFLQNRKFKVRLGSTFSASFRQEQGYPQGSILSIILFIVKINAIRQCLSHLTESSLFVDDFSISCCGKRMTFIERTLQTSINAVHKWATENGFKFSSTKTVCIHFCNRRLSCPDPYLTLGPKHIPVVKEFKFLGLIFDSRLTFIPHLRNLRTKAQKAIGLIKVVAAKGWGADRLAKTTLYRALVRSKLDYGSMVYGSARPSYLKMLDPVQHQAIRLCLNAFRTTPVESLHVEANEMPLDLRRLKLAMQYAIKLFANPCNPAYSVVFTPKFEREFLNSPRTIPPFGLRMKPHIQAAGINTILIAEQTVSETPKWRLEKPVTNLALSSYSKRTTTPDQYRALFSEYRDQHHDANFIFTDGSKSGENVGAAAVYQDRIHSVRIPDKASIFTAEIRALQLALTIIKISNRRKFIICMDSLSVMQSLCSMLETNPLITQFLDDYTEVKDREIILCWVPSHVGIQGNESADQAAKEALNLEVTDMFIPHSDYKESINKYVVALWREYWSYQRDNKLFRIGATIGTTQPLEPTIREDTIIRRLRMGHTYYTHSYLMCGDPQPFCYGCNVPVSVKHVLIGCVDFALVRSRYFNVRSLQELFSSVETSTIIDYTKEIRLFDRF